MHNITRGEGLAPCLASVLVGLVEEEEEEEGQAGTQERLSHRLPVQLNAAQVPWVSQGA